MNLNALSETITWETLLVSSPWQKSWCTLLETSVGHALKQLPKETSQKLSWKALMDKLCWRAILEHYLAKFSLEKIFETLSGSSLRELSLKRYRKKS